MVFALVIDLCLMVFASAVLLRLVLSRDQLLLKLSIDLLVMLFFSKQNSLVTNVLITVYP